MVVLVINAVGCVDTGVGAGGDVDSSVGVDTVWMADGDFAT
jgi:hypothetical protein